MFLKVAGYSLLYRKFSVLLTVLSVTLSTFVLLGIEHIRTEARESFGNTVSGVDLIVGARTGQL
ncbi:MAG TPA: ABC transporter permease, partial [Nitrosomonas sp.]|nr:ABC transporter permease [Nitrosomonas sp.]